MAASGVAEIRYAGPGDAAALTDFYESLDDESRYRRFLQPVPRVAPAMADHVLTPPNAVLVAVDLDGAVVAETVFAPPRRPDRIAEIAYAVAPTFRRRGLARSMVAQVLDDARRDGVREVEAMIGADNRPSVALMRSFGARIRYDDGALMAHLDLSG